MSNVKKTSIENFNPANSGQFIDRHVVITHDGGNNYTVHSGNDIADVYNSAESGKHGEIVAHGVPQNSDSVFYMARKAKGE